MLVAKGGQVIYRRATGSSDLTRPLSTDAVFRIGSITKQFTAMAILQFVRDGKLNLTDELQAHLDFPKKEWPVTIEQLLTHFARGDRAGILEQSIGQRALAVVDVSDDAKISNV